MIQMGGQLTVNILHFNIHKATFHQITSIKTEKKITLLFTWMNQMTLFSSNLSKLFTMTPHKHPNYEAVLYRKKTPETERRPAI